MSESGYTFKGWLGESPDAAKGKMVWREFEPKTWTENDVDIRITHCGICASDIHTLRSGWGPTPYPCCVGHEIVGHAVRVGSNVKHIKKGQRCGVGAQSDSCLKPDCEECSAGLEQYCRHGVNTFAGQYADGSKSMGGYADYSRVPGHFVIPIPDGLSSAEAAPMLCGGITSYSPLKVEGAGPGKVVGIIGFGGLGHFGILFAKALKCDKVVCVSRTSAKKADAQKMGVDTYIATDEDKDWYKKHERSVDLLVCTVSSPQMPLSRYLRLLRTRGTFIQVGAPEDKVPAMNMFSFIGKGIKMGGSSIGSPKDIADMLQFAVDNKVKTWYQERPMKQANNAVVDMEDGKARYRYVLVNEANSKL